ncbi:DUF421 domain-containing protein [Georgenia muralis]|uniref:Uncharacterized membrane protein YcaP (DUF421 family) n=1 Tax=Georgenia muralis TaxID=154117 RepID=A0A3N4Z7P9_9MICO|nr:YetF domain-containing protein [Georgenia muralis]RPF28337.1 uncharacterized membrane protein YcaP (DUF421 family) [Georgenia muralis]
MWFDSWSDLLRIAVVGTAAYVTVVVVLRVAGKRALAKLNAFDLVVTVALGSTLATILLSSDISWSEGALALGVLAVLQLAVTWTSSRRPHLRSAVTSGPTLVLRDGEPLPAVREQRLTVEELRQAVRSTGLGSMADVAAIVLESDGTLSVIPADKLGDASALSGLDGPPSRLG